MHSDMHAILHRIPPQKREKCLHNTYMRVFGGVTDFRRVRVHVSSTYAHIFEPLLNKDNSTPFPEKKEAACAEECGKNSYLSLHDVKDNFSRRQISAATRWTFWFIHFGVSIVYLLYNVHACM